MRAYLAAGVLCIIIGAFWLGYRQGQAVCEGSHSEALLKAQREAVRAADQASRLEVDRLMAEAEADALAEQIEDMAYADPPSDGCGLGSERVRRLNQL